LYNAAHARIDEIAAEREQAVAERDRYRDALEQITAQATDRPHARRIDRDEMRSIARAALAVSTP
jgi:poly(3-hydroxybutyrate) depolymerase